VTRVVEMSRPWLVSNGRAKLRLTGGNPTTENRERDDEERWPGCRKEILS
jgi:hypothetical protein